MFTWLIGNDANVEWQPTASVSLSDGLFGDCSAVEPIGFGDVSPVTCTILISTNMPPMSEPSFVLKLEGGGVEYTENVGLLVATVLESSWVQERTTPFTTGLQEELEVTLLNAGNVAFSHKLVVDGSKNWVAEIDGNDIANLEPGESMKIRLLVRADLPGDGTLTLGLQGSQGMTNSSIELQVSSDGEPIGTSGQSLPIGGMLVGVVFVALLAGAVIFTQRKSKTSSQPQLMMPKTPIHPKPLPALKPIAPIAQINQKGPMCWACRNEITDGMLGCPGCGARYHRADHSECSSDKLTHCMNCQTPMSSFVEA